MRSAASVTPDSSRRSRTSRPTNRQLRIAARSRPTKTNDQMIRWARISSGGEGLRSLK
jgi:hypothetical protein